MSVISSPDRRKPTPIVRANDAGLLVRAAFRKSVRELNLAEEHWSEHAKLLLQELTGHEPDQCMIDRIIER